MVLKSAPRMRIPNLMIENITNDVFGDSMHKKRVKSLTNATVGLAHSMNLSIHIIGQGLAQAKGLCRKHCIKQVDRFLGNEAWTIKDCFKEWVPYIVAERKEILVAMDWSNFDDDGHTTLMLSMITGHSRSTPLIWRSIEQSKLKGKMNQTEDDCLMLLKTYLEDDVKVTIIADRGFADIKLFEYLKETLKFEYIIRMREGTNITYKNIQKPGAKWLGKEGRAKSLKNAYVTDQDYEVPMVVCVKKRKMKEPWILAVSQKNIYATKAIKSYGKRWGIETGFRDVKDHKFGMGMKHMHTSSTTKRDKLFLVSALTIALLTLFGAAGDAANLERTIKANTSKKRTFSFFRQGCIYYAMLPNMKKEWFESLMREFSKKLKEHKRLDTILGFL